jgi:hypothetical protein
MDAKSGLAIKHLAELCERNEGIHLLLRFFRFYGFPVLGLTFFRSSEHFLEGFKCLHFGLLHRLAHGFGCFRKRLVGTVLRIAHPA